MARSNLPKTVATNNLLWISTDAIQALIQKHKTARQAEAWEVLRVLLDKPESPHKMRGREPEEIDRAAEAYEAWTAKLKVAFSEKLNEDSIWELFEIVASKRVEMALEKAKRDQETHRSDRARAAAEALHNKPGGTREKQSAIRESWATGNFATRIDCAEQGYAHFGMSFYTAQDALKGTPDPSPWPAKRKKKAT